MPAKSLYISPYYGVLSMDRRDAYDDNEIEPDWIQTIYNHRYVVESSFNMIEITYK